MIPQQKKKPAITGKVRRRAKEAPRPDLNQHPGQGRSSKLDLLIKLLSRPKGASLADLVTATGWQAHSVRGALAGSLKKKGHTILSEKTEGGTRRYRIPSA